MVLNLKVLILNIKPNYNRPNLIPKDGFKFRVIIFILLKVYLNIKTVLNFKVYF